MKIKTAELAGPALDYATALALGKRSSMFIFRQTGALSKERNYSTDWAQGGPLIDLAGIAVSFGPQWTAVHNQRLGRCYYGPTPLIAICRCYVASKLGDTVDIPEELLCPSPLTNSAS